MIRAARLRFSTVNRQEMSQFDQISDWWHPSGPMHVLYRYNYHRVTFLKRHLARTRPHPHPLLPLQGLRALDVGCGAGFLTESLARLGAEVVGLDPNASSFREASDHRAKLREELPNLSYCNCTLEEYLPGVAQKFDIVSSMDVIEHVDNPQQFLSSISQAVGEGGTVMVSTIAKSPATWLTHILLAEYVTGIVPRGTHDYEKFISPNRLIEMLMQQGLQVSDRLELDLDWRGEFVQKDGGGNYILLAHKAPKQ